MGRTSQFGFERQPATDRLAIHVHGEIDALTASALLDELRDAVKQAPETVVDLHDVTFIDSVGIHALVDAYNHASCLGNRMTVTGAQQWVARVLDITGVASLLCPPPETTP